MKSFGDPKEEELELNNKREIEGYREKVKSFAFDQMENQWPKETSLLRPIKKQSHVVI